ncbi:MAG: hypothetical protein KC731_12180 [Myxococcales bacterium]|nr:hypothetical protein [Myxococcales bacterium]
MVNPDDVPRVLNDAARRVGHGEIVIFGAALALWLDRAPSSKDVDLWVSPEDRGEIVEALMGELSWYHDKHGAYVEVCGPETFEAPASWRSRAKTLVLPDYEDVAIVVPHPHDVLVAKLPRWSPSDRDHIDRILAQFPMRAAQLDALANECPSRSGHGTEADRRAFEANLEALRRTLPP